MPDKKEESAVIDLESDIDSMVSVLRSEAPPAPSINEITKSEEVPRDSDQKSILKGRETVLAGIDDLLISRGARLILFIPIVVVVLFGLAQSYRSSDPDWWQGGVRELFLDLSFSKSVYLLSLALMVADLVLLFVLHYLLWVTKRIFQIETEEIVSTGVTFRSAHGYSEMKAVIDGASNQLNLTTSLMTLSTIMLSLALMFPSEPSLPVTPSAQ